MQVFCAHLRELGVALPGEGDEFGFVVGFVGVFGLLPGAQQAVLPDLLRIRSAKPVGLRGTP